MPGLSHLREVYDKRGKDFLEGLLNKHVIINEKMDGTFFGVKLEPDTGKFKFFKKNSEISYVDRVLSRYFEPAIRHFESLSPEIVKSLPEGYHFGMEWFTSPRQQSIAYDRMPKNGLMLSHIRVHDTDGSLVETIQDKETLDEWADRLQIERAPIVFQGKLNDSQKTQILDFVYTPFEELIDKFKTVSFTNYIMSVLNPKMDSTFLRDTLDKDIDGLVFRFYEPGEKSDDSVFLAKLVDPVFVTRAKQEPASIQKKSDDYIWIIVIDLMNFIERYSMAELRAIPMNGDTYEKRYISLINHIYKEFVNEFGDKYRDLEIQIPEFLTREDFDVNFKLINDKRVVSLIESNPNFKEIYRVLLNIFRKKKIRTNTTFFTKQMKDNLNSQIDKISKVVIGDTVFENYFPTFSEFVGEDREPGYFETFAEVPEEKKRAKSVNLIVSDFQPIHLGHVKAAQTLFDKTGFPCILVCIHDGSTSEFKPFKKETVVSGLEKLKASHPSFIEDYRVVPDSEVENLIRVIKPNYEPVTIASSKGRIKDLALQMELAKKRSRNLNLKKNLALVETPHASIKDQIMQSVKAGDYSAFKKIAPPAIHSEFFNLNRDATSSLNESISIFNLDSQAQSIDDVVNILSQLKNESHENFDRAMLKINRALGSMRAEDHFTIIKEELINRNYLEIDAIALLEQMSNDLTDSHIEHGEIIDFANYIKDGAGLELTGPAGIISASEFGPVSPRIVKRIMQATIKTKTGTTQGKGTGEMIAVLFKDGVKKIGAGDIQIGNELIEVKGNKGRLISSGAGEGSALFTNGRQVIENKLAQLAKMVKSEEFNDYLRMDLDDIREINLKQAAFLPNSGWFALRDEAMGFGVTADQFSNWFASIFSGEDGIWSKGCDHEDDLREGVKRFFDSPGDPVEFITFLGYHSLLYYSKVDNFSRIMTVSQPTQQIVHFKVDLGFDEFRKLFVCKSGPQWQDSQNHNVFSIEIL